MSPKVMGAASFCIFLMGLSTLLIGIVAGGIDGLVLAAIGAMNTGLGVLLVILAIQQSKAVPKCQSCGRIMPKGQKKCSVCGHENLN
ncbi:MAG: hypothetical protein HZB92_07465 [Euryarchaeota archaeon]|nr:hypothetical protein [Euryarchaeota archaeon]